MSKGDKYVKLVEWSDEDRCFIGSCPELFYGGCHGQDAKAVFAELCEIIEDTGIARLSVESSGSRVTHSTTPFSV